MSAALRREEAESRPDIRVVSRVDEIFAAHEAQVAEMFIEAQAALDAASPKPCACGQCRYPLGGSALGVFRLGIGVRRVPLYLIPREDRRPHWVARNSVAPVLIELLLDPDDSRSRDRVAREDAPEIFITIPNADSDAASSAAPPLDDETIEIPNEHLMALDQRMRWIPARSHGQVYEVDRDKFSQAQFFSQTNNLDETATWEWAGIRSSTIRTSIAGTKAAALPKPKRVEEIAIDRADMRSALGQLAPGELRALYRRFCGLRLSSSQRTQLQRALFKTRGRRFPGLTDIDIER